MNTVRILICATFALLIAALVHSYSTKGEPEEKTVSQLEEELRKVRLEKQLQRERAATTPVVYTQQSNPYATPVTPVLPAPDVFVNPLPVVPPVTPPATDAELARIDALEIENAKLKAKQAEQESENNMLNQETDAIKDELLASSKPPATKSEEERAALIAQALVMARVQTYSVNNALIVLELVRAQNLTTGQVLGIRRGDAGGILGRIKLGRMESGIGYADPIAESFFGGPVDVKVGDEIIIIP